MRSGTENVTNYVTWSICHKQYWHIHGVCILHNVHTYIVCIHILYCITMVTLAWFDTDWLNNSLGNSELCSSWNPPSLAMQGWVFWSSPWNATTGPSVLSKLSTVATVMTSNSLDLPLNTVSFTPAKQRSGITNIKDYTITVTVTVAVEPPNKGYFRIASFVLSEEVVLSGRLKIIVFIGRKYSETSTHVLYREAVLILECPLSETLLQLYSLTVYRNSIMIIKSLSPPFIPAIAWRHNHHWLR